MSLNNVYNTDIVSHFIVLSCQIFETVVLSKLRLKRLLWINSKVSRFFSNKTWTWLTQVSFLTKELQIIKLYRRCIFQVRNLRTDRNFVSFVLPIFEFVFSLYTKIKSCNSRLSWERMRRSGRIFLLCLNSRQKSLFSVLRQETVLDCLRYLAL